MPPKRKAASVVAPDNSPPLKRRLRSGKGPMLDARPADPPARMNRRRTTVVPSYDSDTGEHSGLALIVETSQRTTAKRRGRPLKVPHQAEVEPESTVEDVEPSTSKTTLEEKRRSRRSRDPSVEPDELLLTPPKRLVPRPVTPPRTGTSTPKYGTPRYVLHSVEIVTPSWLKNPTLRDVASPGPRSPRKRDHHPLTATAVFPHMPSTPSKSNHARTPHPSPSRSPRKRVEVEFEDFPKEHQSPVKPVTVPPARSPSKGKGKTIVTSIPSPSRLPRVLPDALHSCLNAQQRATLRVLQEMSAVDLAEYEEEDSPPANITAYEQLINLLKGTIERGEGNSCLLVGPRGSGKTQLVERAISTQSEKPIVIRLSGHAQTDDRLAIREIAWQLAQQTGKSLLPFDEPEESVEIDMDNPFVDTAQPIMTLPPPAQLLALISVIPTLSRPTIIIIDAFDLFTLHARQSLLYCLFDTAQHSKVGVGGKGMAVIGVTTRVDTINMLEKRVKSRFSGRILRSACPSRLIDWMHCARTALCTSIDADGSDEWAPLWEKSVHKFLQDTEVVNALSETFSLTRDVRMLSRILTSAILELTPSSPFLSHSHCRRSVDSQRCPPRFPYLNLLPYPSICLLITATHAQTSGHDTFTFEMLHEAFRNQVRMSLSAPVHIEGGGIGMVRCSREVLMGAFERLVSIRAFVAVTPPSIGTAREFVRYRCAIDRGDIKRAVEKMGQLNLKKWLGKAQ